MPEPVNGLITLEAAKKSIYNQYSASAVIDELDLIEYIEAATPVVEDVVGPIVVTMSTFARDGGKTGIQLPSRFSEVESVTEDGEEISDFIPSPTDGIIYAGSSSSRRRFNPGIRNIVATVTVGRPLPPNVKLATRELVKFWWQQGRQGNARPGIDSEAPSEPMATTPSGFLIPRRVLQLLQPDSTTGAFG